MPLLFQRRLRAENRPVTAGHPRAARTSPWPAPASPTPPGSRSGSRPHDFRRIFITDAIMHGMPPHIAQLIAGHRDINTTMGYKAVYPEEVINGHRAFIARRRALRPSEEYRTPTDAEWEEFLGHFERRKVALGDCGRAYGTSCIHEHSCIRCPLLRPRPRPAAPARRHPRQPASPASPKPNAKAGPAKPKDSKSASPPPTAKLAQIDELAARRATAVGPGHARPLPRPPAGPSSPRPRARLSSKPDRNSPLPQLKVPTRTPQIHDHLVQRRPSSAERVL